MMPFNATVTVEAPADWLWALITNFAHYDDWNPLVPTIRGEPRLNARLKLLLAPASRRPITLRARVLVAARNRELRWQGRSRIPGLLKLEHGFRIEQRAGSCRLHHGLSCSGWLAERLADALRESFEATNQGLLARTGAGADVAVPTVTRIAPLAPAPAETGSPALTLTPG
jgi:hypothetical protein